MCFEEGIFILLAKRAWILCSAALIRKNPLHKRLRSWLQPLRLKKIVAAKSWCVVAAKTGILLFGYYSLSFAMIQLAAQRIKSLDLHISEFRFDIQFFLVRLRHNDEENLRLHKCIQEWNGNLMWFLRVYWLIPTGSIIINVSRSWQRPADFALIQPPMYVPHSTKLT